MARNSESPQVSTISFSASISFQFKDTEAFQLAPHEMICTCGSVASCTFLAFWIEYAFWFGFGFGVIINSWKRHLLYFNDAGQLISPPLEMLDGLKKFFLSIWSPTCKKMFQARHSSSGVCNRLCIFMVASRSCFYEPLKEVQVWIDDGTPHFRAFLRRFYVLFLNTNIDHGPF